MNRQKDIELAWLAAVSEGVFPSLRELATRIGLSNKAPATVSRHLVQMIEDGTMVPLYGGDQVHATVPPWVQEEARKRLRGDTMPHKIVVNETPTQGVYLHEGALVVVEGALSAGSIEVVQVRGEG